MPINPDIQSMVDALLKYHNGKAYFSFGEISKMIGCGVNNVPRLLHDSGVLIKKIGTCKKVSAFDIATIMCAGRIAPIDNSTRVKLPARTSGFSTERRPPQ